MKTSKKIYVVLLVVYIIALLYFVFFAEIMGRTDVASGFRYNLEPFKEIGRFIRYASQVGLYAVGVNIIGNIAVFIPFGYFTGIFMKKPKRIWVGVFLTCLFSMAIEGVQLVTKVGICDIDDVILNTLGGAIGIVLYKIIFSEREPFEDEVR